MQTLQDWLTVNKPSDEMRFKDGYWRQAMFIRDRIAGLLMAAERCDEDTGLQRFKELVKVASTHTSKSISLPVYRIDWHGIQFTMRDNFHDWKISVKSEYPLEIDFEEIFTDDIISSCYFEGFSESWVYGPYSENNQEFSVELGSDYSVWFFFYKIKRFVMQKEFVEIRPYEKIREALDKLPDKWKNDKSLIGDDTMFESCNKALEKNERLNSVVPPYGRLNTIFSLTFKHTKAKGVPFKISYEDLDIKKEAYLGVFGTVPSWLTEAIEETESEAHDYWLHP